jgi:hypothetical protein
LITTRPISVRSAVISPSSVRAVVPLNDHGTRYSRHRRRLFRRYVQKQRRSLAKDPVLGALRCSRLPRPESCDAISARAVEGRRKRVQRAQERQQERLEGVIALGRVSRLPSDGGCVDYAHSDATPRGRTGRNAPTFVAHTAELSARIAVSPTDQRVVWWPESCSRRGLALRSRWGCPFPIDHSKRFCILIETCIG